MPTVLQINTYDGGSTGSIARNINTIAEQNGWSAYIYYGRDSYHKSDVENVRIIGRGLCYRIRIFFHGFITRLFDRHGCGSCQDTKRLISELDRIKPDIIHLHNIHGYYLNYKKLFNYLQKVNIPVVWTLHDCWSMTGHCTHFESAKCDRWHSGCYNCPLRKEYPSSLILDRSKKNYIEKKQYFSSIKNLTLVPVSNWIADVVRHSFLKNANVSVVHNGIDVQVFRPCLTQERIEQYNLDDKRVVLGVASPWSDKKGLPDFVRLYDLLSKNIYQVVLIGLTSEQIKSLPKGVIGLCRTNSAAELAEWYSAADLFVNLTYEDTYPTTNLEAISCGTPVITYRTGGSPESVTPQTGRVVDQGDLEGVVKAIEELCTEDREVMRKRCREYALEHFDRNKNYEKYINLYEHLLQK